MCSSDLFMPLQTVTVPCFNPVGSAQLPNSAMVCSGLADVVISQSPGVRLSSRSRTQPPTAQPSWPPAASRSIKNSTGRGKATSLCLISILFPLSALVGAFVLMVPFPPLPVKIPRPFCGFFVASSLYLPAKAVL